MEEKKWQKYTSLVSLGDIPVAEEGEALAWVKKQHGMGCLMLAGQDTLYATTLIEHFLTVRAGKDLSLYSCTQLHQMRVLASNKTYTSVSVDGSEFPVAELLMSPIKMARLVLRNGNQFNNVDKFVSILSACVAKGIKSVSFEGGLTIVAKHIRALVPFVDAKNLAVTNSGQDLNSVATEVSDVIKQVGADERKREEVENAVYKAVMGDLGTTRFYDLVLDLGRMSDVTSGGWKLRLHNVGAIKAIKATTVVVCVIGEYNRGKTHVISKIARCPLPSGTNVHTVGLSFKKCDVDGSDVLVLDTAGTNSAVGCVTTEILREKKAEEEFLRDVSFRMSDVMVFVMRELTSKDQIECHRLAQEWLRQHKQGSIIVLHNMYHIKTMKAFQREWEKLKRAYTTHDEVEIDGVRFLKGCTPDAVGCQDHFMIGHDDADELKAANEATISYIRSGGIFHSRKKADKKFADVQEVLTATVNKVIGSYFTAKIQAETVSTPTKCGVCSLENKKGEDVVCLLENDSVRGCDHVFHSACRAKFAAADRCPLCSAVFKKVRPADDLERFEAVICGVPDDATAPCRLREQSLGVYLMSSSAAPQEVIVTDDHIILCIEAPGLALKARDVTCHMDRMDIVVKVSAKRALPPWIPERGSKEHFQEACTRISEDFTYESRICMDNFPRTLQPFEISNPADTTLYRQKTTDKITKDGVKEVQFGNGILTIMFATVKARVTNDSNGDRDL